MPGAVGQVSALVRMRFGALRGPARYRAATGLGVLPVLAVAAAVVGIRLPASGRFDAQLLMSTAWLGFALTAVFATAAGGSRTLLPRDQTVAFPLTPAAEHLGTLLLAPLNVAWISESLSLLALATWAFGRDGLLVPALLSTLLWIAAATSLAQAVGWLVELARTAQVGTWLLRGLAAGLAGAGIALVVTHRLAPMLDRAPTIHLVQGIAAVGAGRPGHWLLGLLGLVAATALAYPAGVRLAALAHRRPARDQTRVEARLWPRRPDPESELAAALRIDRAGVWRSAPLRRGLAVLVAIPALAAAGAGLDWPLIAVLPGLVSSGAGLLFGVNALSLDGSGAVWRVSLPGSARTLLVARLLVVGEICLGAALLATVIGAARAGRPPTTAELVGVLGAVVTTTAQVIGRCAAWSVDRPYAATLRDARDQPAPPAAMAGYSARLAFGTTLSGMVFSFAARNGLTTFEVLFAIAATALAARRALSALNRWDDETTRSRVIATVAG
jgi:hypothetical protein